MSNELLCAQGHVIDTGRDTCSRCNGPAVNLPVPEQPPVDNEHVADGATQFNDDGSTKDTTPMSDENETATPATDAPASDEAKDSEGGTGDSEATPAEPSAEPAGDSASTEPAPEDDEDDEE